jgi:DUF1680 family protein
MHGYAYSIGDEGLWVHHYGGNIVQTRLADGRGIKLTQETKYPWEGKVRLVFDEVESDTPFAVCLRIPGWARDAGIRVNGDHLDVPAEPSSYARIERRWRAGDTIELQLPMPVRMIVADPRVEQTRNQVAVMRGPIVYCLESIDLPEDVRFEDVHIPRGAKWTAHFEPDLLRGVTVLETQGVVPPRSEPAGGLYREMPAGEPRRIAVRLIPYFAWNNRGEPKMNVWLPLY